MYLFVGRLLDLMGVSCWLPRELSSHSTHVDPAMAVAACLLIVDQHGSCHRVSVKTYSS